MWGKFDSATPWRLQRDTQILTIYQMHDLFSNGIEASRSQKKIYCAAVSDILFSVNLSEPSLEYFTCPFVTHFLFVIGRSDRSASGILYKSYGPSVPHHWNWFISQQERCFPSREAWQVSQDTFCRGELCNEFHPHLLFVNLQLLYNAKSSRPYARICDFVASHWMSYTRRECRN